MATAQACGCSTGRLHVEDGIGPHRRSLVVDRAGSGLERLVLLGKTGSLTLEALAWLRAIGAALVHLGPDGTLLAHSVPFGYDGHPIRRAQALAATTGLDVSLACYLIAEKLDGQRRNLVRLKVSNLAAFDRLREALETRRDDRGGTPLRGAGRRNLLERLANGPATPARS